jgi:hypothetical protein
LKLAHRPLRRKKPIVATRGPKARAKTSGDNPGTSPDKAGAQVCLHIVSQVPRRTANNLARELRLELGDIDVRVRSGTGAFAALEVLIPTAIVLWFADKYFGAMVGQLGKEHLDALKRASAAIWKRLFGEKPEARFVLFSRDGVKKTQFSRTFSVCARSRDGGRITLVFAENIAVHEFQAAHTLFLRLLARHRAAGGPDELTRASDAAAHGKPAARRNDILFYNAVARKLELLDVVESSRLRKTVSTPIS